MPNRRQLPDRLLDDWEERQLATQIEAGVLAREALDQGPPAMVPADETELRALISAGEQAQDRFVTANLRLVSMVTAPHAARGQLGYADLFQEGCLGLPFCQVATGSSASDVVALALSQLARVVVVPPPALI